MPLKPDEHLVDIEGLASLEEMYEVRSKLSEAGLPIPLTLECSINHEKMKQRLRAPAVIIRPRGLTEIVERGYDRIVRTWEYYGVSAEGMPTLSALMRKELIPEDVLECAMKKMRSPTLNLIPPLTRQEMIKVIDTKPHPFLKQDSTYAYNLENDALWSGGVPEMHSEWEMGIEEGAEEVPFSPECYWKNEASKQKRSMYEMIKLLLDKYTNQHLDILCGARRYLSLMMNMIVRGKPIDPDTITLLNAKTANSSAYIAAGGWSENFVYLDRVDPTKPFEYIDNRLRVRSSVTLNLST